MARPAAVKPIGHVLMNSNSTPNDVVAVREEGEHQQWQALAAPLTVSAGARRAGAALTASPVASPAHCQSQDNEQQLWLKDASASIKKSSFFLRKAMVRAVPWQQLGGAE